MASKLHWLKVGKCWHAKAGVSAYQIRKEDGRFCVYFFATPKSQPTDWIARADNLDSAQGFCGSDFAKREAA